MLYCLLFLTSLYLVLITKLSPIAKNLSNQNANYSELQSSVTYISVKNRSQEAEIEVKRKDKQTETESMSTILEKGERDLRIEVLEIFENEVKLGRHSKCSNTLLKLPRKKLDPELYNVDDCTTAPFLIMDSRGRLGNQLCEYFSIVVLQQLFGFRAVLSRKLHTTISSVFKTVKIPPAPPNCKTVDKAYGTIRWLFIDSFNKNRSRTSAEDLINMPTLITGNPCDYEFLIANRNLLQEELEVKEPHSTNVSSSFKIMHKINNIDGENRTHVGIHIRRGDYDEYMARKKFTRKLASTCYFQRAINFFRDRYEKPLFIVAGSESTWNKIHLGPLSKGNDVIFSENKEPLMDMLLLSQCDHHILTLGSFGFMTSFLGKQGRTVHSLEMNKDIIYMERFFICANKSDYVGIPECSNSYRN